MNVVYLKKLQENPKLEINESGHFSSIQGISEFEISQLEQLYNNGLPFPKVLKELLFLGGEYCYVCDYGPNDTQEDLQEWIRDHLVDRNKIINRPFYVFDVYNGFPFLFIYLDEGDNPSVYEADPFNPDINWIRVLPNQTIKSIVEIGVKRVLRGENPY